MKTKIRCVASVVLLVIAVAIGQGLAQDGVPEEHVKQITEERGYHLDERALSQPLCQQAKTDGRIHVHYRTVSPGTLESDLSVMMQKSDEVVLTGMPIRNVMVISPSGEDVVAYWDAKVLRSWKGSHKVGDLITFATPTGFVSCGNGRAGTVTGFHDPTMSKTGDFQDGPLVLFLRQSRGADEVALMPGLRLTGGDGTQGVFSFHQSPPNNCTCASWDIRISGCPYSDPKQSLDAYFAGFIAHCNSDMDVNNEPVEARYILGPLGKKYDGMPIASLLREVQSAADGLVSAASTK